MSSGMSSVVAEAERATVILRVVKKYDSGHKTVYGEKPAGCGEA